VNSLLRFTEPRCESGTGATLHRHSETLRLEQATGDVDSSGPPSSITGLDRGFARQNRRLIEGYCSWGLRLGCEHLIRFRVLPHDPGDRALRPE